MNIYTYYFFLKNNRKHTGNHVVDAKFVQAMWHPNALDMRPADWTLAETRAVASPTKWVHPPYCTECAYGDIDQWLNRQQFVLVPIARIATTGATNYADERRLRAYGLREHGAGMWWPSEAEERFSDVPLYDSVDDFLADNGFTFPDD